MAQQPALPARQPPHSIDAEQFALGTALISTSAVEKVLERLDTPDFYNRAHQWIFDAIAYLHAQPPPKNKIDFGTVGDELRKRGVLERVGGLEYLLTLQESVPAHTHVESYIDTIWEASVRRRLISSTNELTETAYDETVPLADLERQSQALADAPLARDESTIKDSQQLMQATGDAYGPRAEGKEQRYFRSSYPSLDRYAEFAAGDLVIIAARPSVGKTALALEMALGGALKGQSVGMFSLEMNAVKVGIRIQSSFTARQDLHQGVPLVTIRDHAKPDVPVQLTPEQIQQLQIAEQAIGMLPLVIVDEPGLTMPRIAALAKQMVRQYGVTAIFVDYLQLIEHAPGENQNVRVTHTTKALKNLARRLNITVFALSQLSRKSEQRGKKERRPMLSDLRESGAIEQEADAVILLHREEYYERSEHPGADDGEGGMEAIVAKSRNGAVGTVRLGTSLRCGRIFEQTNRYDEAPPEHWERTESAGPPVEEDPIDEEWWK